MAIGTMLDYVARNWGWLVFRGVAAIVFGVLAFVWPGITLAVLVLFWGAYALADGLLSLLVAFRIKDEGKPMWPLIVVGFFGIVVGVYTFMNPAMTAVVLLSFIAAWAIVTGIFQVVAAVRLRKVIANEWMLGFSGVLSVLFGVLMALRPGAGALAVVWLIASYSILFGITLAMFGFRLRGIARTIMTPA